MQRLLLFLALGLGMAVLLLNAWTVTTGGSWIFRM